jgi:hypothetical protein
MTNAGPVVVFEGIELLVVVDEPPHPIAANAAIDREA